MQAIYIMFANIFCQHLLPYNVFSW